jgi:hypothetical protein
MGEAHRLVGVADAGAFLARLTRLDPAAPVRLRSVPVPVPVPSVAGVAGVAPSAAAGGRVELWARLPWAVLVTRAVAGAGPGDATVGAADLLAELARGGGALPTRRDADWRWPVPVSAGRVLETMPGRDLRGIAAAAAGALRSAATGGVAGRAVGQRALRDALLDHVAVVVTIQAGDRREAGGRVEISQRLVQAVVRMGFLRPDGVPDQDGVQVRLAGRWIGLAAPFGTAWSQKASPLSLRPIAVHPNR